jgi:hypothetical protein
MANTVHAPLLVFSRQGGMPSLLSHFRPDYPIFAFCDNTEVALGLELASGGLGLGSEPGVTWAAEQAPSRTGVPTGWPEPVPLHRPHPFSPQKVMRHLALYHGVIPFHLDFPQVGGPGCCVCGGAAGGRGRGKPVKQGRGGFGVAGSGTERRDGAVAAAPTARKPRGDRKPEMLPVCGRGRGRRAEGAGGAGPPVEGAAGGHRAERARAHLAQAPHARDPGGRGPRGPAAPAAPGGSTPSRGGGRGSCRQSVQADRSESQARQH